MRPEDIRDRAFIEQLVVSGAVLRQAENLPPELVEYHRNILQGMGLLAEAVASLPREYLIGLLDQVDQLNNY